MDTKQKEQVKKILVFSGLGLIFILSLWFIFKPSFGEKEEQKGLNQTIPQAAPEQLTDNKLKAYELGNKAEQDEQSRQDMGKLSDYFDAATSNEKEKNELQENNENSSKIETSIKRYEDNSQLLSSFYDRDTHEEQLEEMQRKIDELQEKLAEKQNISPEEEEERQLAMIEKSYQMAAKYLPNATHLPSAQPTATSTVNNEVKKDKVDPAELLLKSIKQQQELVSTLSPMLLNNSNTFHSVYGKHTAIERNTISAVIDKTVTLKDGDYAVLRLMEPACFDNIILPKNSRIYAQAKLNGNRLFMRVKSIEMAGRIIPIKLTVYDVDGQEGVSIPDYENMTALKEMGANIGNSMGTSFTFSSSAKEQLISEVTRGVMQGANQLLQKKLRDVKITIKGGYKLFLLQTK